MGYITPPCVMLLPITMSTPHLLFRFIFPPTCTRLWLIFAVVLSIYFVIISVALVTLDVLFGLLLFQTGCALVVSDNIPFLLLAFLILFLKLVALCSNMVLKCVKVPYCYHACRCTPNKQICFLWGGRVFMIVTTVIVTLVIMVLIIASPNLGYINR